MRLNWTGPAAAEKNVMDVGYDGIQDEKEEGEAPVYSLLTLVAEGHTWTLKWVEVHKEAVVVEAIQD